MADAAPPIEAILLSDMAEAGIGSWRQLAIAVTNLDGPNNLDDVDNYIRKIRKGKEAVGQVWADRFGTVFGKPADRYLRPRPTKAELQALVEVQQARIEDLERQLGLPPDQ